MRRYGTHALVAILAILAPAPAARSEVRRYEINPRNTIVWVEGDPWQPEEIDRATPIRALLVSEGPGLDGRGDDAVWRGAEPVTVSLSHGGIKEATIQAVYTEDDLFLMISWPDATRDDRHHPWEWNAELGRYVESPAVEDSLLVSIESGCEWTPSLLSGYVYDFDGWRWLAARSNPLGQAIDVNGHTQNRWIPDMGFVKYASRSQDPTWQMKILGHEPGNLTRPWQELDRTYQLQQIDREIYVAMEPDGYRTPAFFERLPAPDAGPDASPVVTASLRAGGGPHPAEALQYRPLRLTGDAGEVSASGRWEDGRWTVELQRKRITPARTKTDSILDRVSQFSIHVFDATERVDEASESGRLFLEFLPAESASLSPGGP